MTDRRESHPGVCKSCGGPVADLDAYDNGSGDGPWHRLCIPPHSTHFEQRIAQTLRRVALRSILLALLTPLIFISAPAFAEDISVEIRRQLISSCRYWDNCGQYFRRPAVRPYRHYELRAERVYGYHRDERRYSPECRDIVVAVGEERYGRDRAKESAEQSWMEAVRSKCGARFMDLRNADRGTWECGRSSTGNRASEKTAESLGKFLEQCTLRAVPRRAELEPVGRE